MKQDMDIWKWNWSHSTLEIYSLKYINIQNIFK